MKTASGTIRLVQEHRFQLIDENGRDRLFILSHKAPVEWRDLVAMQRAGRSVTVAYRELDNMIAAEAHDVQRAAGPARGSATAAATEAANEVTSAAADLEQQQQGVYR